MLALTGVSAPTTQSMAAFMVKSIARLGANFTGMLLARADEVIK